MNAESGKRIELAKRAVKAVAEERFLISRAILFGSAAKGVARENSDVDLAFIVKDGELQKDIAFKIQEILIRRKFKIWTLRDRTYAITSIHLNVCDEHDLECSTEPWIYAARTEGLLLYGDPN